MKALLIFSYVSYSMVLLFCVYSIVRFLVSPGAHRSEIPIRLLIAAGVTALTLYSAMTRRVLSGYYAVFLSFVLAPVFLPAPNRARLRFVPAAVVEAVAVCVIAVSCLCGVRTDITAGVMLTVGVMLAFAAGHAVWKVSGGIRRFDGVLSGRDTLSRIADIFYMSVLVVLMCVGKAVGEHSGWLQAVGSGLCVALMGGLVVGIDRRHSENKVFLICAGREKMIDEAVRMEGRGQTEGAKLNPSYENLFFRLKEYFDKNRPYLDPDLTLGDIAKCLLTNKQYLSITINAYTGKNFCQFVNYYRVKYVIETYRRDGGPKMSEIAIRSGFHTVHSFTMAFRLNMNISPSQWCRINKGLK